MRSEIYMGPCSDKSLDLSKRLFWNVSQQMSIPQCVIRLRHVGEHLGCTAGCYALLPFCPSNEKVKLRFPNFPQRFKDCEDVCKYCNLKCDVGCWPSSYKQVSNLLVAHIVVQHLTKTLPWSYQQVISLVVGKTSAHTVVQHLSKTPLLVVINLFSICLRCVSHKLAQRWFVTCLWHVFYCSVDAASAFQTWLWFFWCLGRYI